MKHIMRVSSDVPRKAADVQDILCDVSHQFALVVEAKGGSLPLVSFLDEKCQLIETTNSTN
jgi:hypothetical protein